MRILIHGLQSSGASYFTYLLGQNPNSATILDLHNDRLMPKLGNFPEEVDLIGKCVITTKYSIEDHQNSFQPDKTILFLRHPIHNYQSLINKTYAHQNGIVEQKLALVEHLFKNHAHYFDLIVHYEDIFFRPQRLFKLLNDHQISFEKDFFHGQRELNDIINYTKAQSKWLADNFNVAWGNGNIKFRGHPKRSLFKDYSMTSKKITKIKSPKLLKHYRQYKPESKTNYYRLKYQSWTYNTRRKLYYFKLKLKDLLVKGM